MEFSYWLSLLVICALGAMNPGPSLAVIIQITANNNRQHGITAAIAHGLGIGCYAFLAALGLAVVITQNPTLFNGLKLIGAGFLLYFGLRALGVITSLSPANKGHQANANTHNLSNSFRSGFLIAFLNPSVALFFIALFSQFVREHTDLLEKLIMAGTAATVDAMWYCLVATVVTKPQVIARFSGYGERLEKLFGVLIILLAVKVVLD